MEKPKAKLVIYNASEMQDWERREIATWLRKHAFDIVKLGGVYSKRFTGRYYG